MATASEVLKKLAAEMFITGVAPVELATNVRGSSAAPGISAGGPAKVPSKVKVGGPEFSVSELRSNGPGIVLDAE